MKTKLLALVLLGCVLWIVKGYCYAQNNEPVTITGFIEVTMEDEDGNATEVAIYSDGTLYTVIGNTLLKHAGLEVEATGIISEDDEGNFFIKISSYKLIDEKE